MSEPSGTELLLLAALTLPLYFLPAIIAVFRKHHAVVGIIIVNFLVGWTGLGWLICLVWAFSAREGKEKIIVVQQTNPDEVKPSFNNADEIKKYADLKEQGIITEEEFIAKKQQLLNN